MVRWIRRLVMVAAVALLTGGGILWWLYDGDLQAAVAPVLRGPRAASGGA